LGALATSQNPMRLTGTAAVSIAADQIHGDSPPVRAPVTSADPTEGTVVVIQASTACQEGTATAIRPAAADAARD